MTPRPSAEIAKLGLIRELKDVRHRILLTAATLGRGARDEVFLGSWSARDLVAHLIGWDHTNLAAIGEVLRGRLPQFYQSRDRDWQTYNALLVKKHGKADYRALLRDARRSHSALIDCIRNTPAEDLARDTGVRARGWKVTMERLLRAELSDERTHLDQLEGFAARRSPRRPTGRAHGLHKT